MGFEQAVAKVLDHEGGFVDDPADRGGMTFMGISRRWFPDEPLWKKIDSLLDEGGNPNLRSKPAVGLAKRKVVPVISCKTRRTRAYFLD